MPDIKTFNQFLNENFEFEYSNDKPKIFQKTIYRLPTKEELIDVNSFNLSDKEILDGFKYTIVGRGIMDIKNKGLIIKSIEMLFEMFPDNEEYKKALIDAELIKSIFI